MAQAKKFTLVSTVIAGRNTPTFKIGDTLHIGIVTAPLDDRRFLVTVVRNNEQVDRLIHGPWCRQTARNKALALAKLLRK